MDAQLRPLVQLLQASLDPRQQKQAEDTIRQQEQSAAFSLALLQIVAAQDVPLDNARLPAAIYFKNFIGRNWIDENGNYKLPENEVLAIKKELIGLMISVPPKLQAQLGEAVSVIADSDFWRRWDTLVDDLVSRITLDNPEVNNGVLQVAHSIFKRWRPLFRSDELFTEINHVLSKFGEPFLQLLEYTDAAISGQSHDDSLRQWSQTLDLIIKLFYDLSCQDLPPVFEDNIQSIANLLHKYLVYDNPALHTNDDSEAGVLEDIKVGIFELLTLYIQKYEDAFGPLLAQFISSSWNLLTTVGPETKNDLLVSKALQFLTAVARNKQHAQTFNSKAILQQVVEKVVLPNLALREVDVELFEDEPIEFIRRDLEGSDSDTRRRAATDFLRQLMEQFEALVTEVVNQYITHYLQEYASNPTQNWKSKDTAVYLFSSIAAKGTPTAAQGVKNVNAYVDVLDFLQKNIVQDLATDNAHPILKVDAIKYLHTFRSQLSQQNWIAAFPLLVQHLGSSNYVVYSYAAIALERVLFMTDSNRQPVIPKADVVKLSKDLLQHLFKLIQKDSAPEKIQENEFLMRCVMRVVIFIGEGVIPILDMVLKNFVNITKVIRHNPSNPRFYYYHFEGIGALVRYAAPSEPQKFESSIHEPFQAILAGGVEEFIPYVFQLYAALLEANPSAPLPAEYQALIQPILMPPLWETKGNVPALVRLLAAMLARGAAYFVNNNLVEQLLGVFQKLIASKRDESHGFDLLEAIVITLPKAALQNYFPTMLSIMLTRLNDTKLKTENFSMRFVRYYHLISAKDDEGYGTDFFVGIADAVQHDVFRPIYTKVVLPDTPKLSRQVDRKTAVVSLTKSLANAEAFCVRYEKGWPLTCETLLKLLINPPLPSKHEEMIMEQDVDDLGFGVGFTQLNTCRKTTTDPFPEITDIKAWVGQYLTEANMREDGKITNFVKTRLSEQARSTLLEYMKG